MAGRQTTPLGELMRELRHAEPERLALILRQVADEEDGAVLRIARRLGVTRTTARLWLSALAPEAPRRDDGASDVIQASRGRTDDLARRLERGERAAIRRVCRALAEADRSQGRAAALLGISHRTLVDWLRRFPALDLEVARRGLRRGRGETDAAARRRR